MTQKLQTDSSQNWKKGRFFNKIFIEFNFIDSFKIYFLNIFFYEKKSTVFLTFK